MGKRSESNHLSQRSTKIAFNKKLIRFLNDKEFLSQLGTLKGAIGQGQNLLEARLRLGIKSETRWDAMLACLGSMTISREKLFMEFHTRNQVRYQQGLDLHSRAKVSKDGDLEARALLLLMKLDENAVDLADKLGLLKVREEGDDGEGYSDEDVRAELERVRSTIEAQFTSQGQALLPVALDDVTNAKPERETNIVGTPPMDANDPK